MEIYFIFLIHRDNQHCVVEQSGFEILSMLVTKNDDIRGTHWIHKNYKEDTNKQFVNSCRLPNIFNYFLIGIWISVSQSASESLFHIPSM